MLSVRSMVTGGAIAVVLAMPAAALDLDIGGIAGVSVGGNSKGGLDVGLDVDVGGDRGAKLESNVSVGTDSLLGERGGLSGGSSLLDTNTSVSVGGAKGINANNSLSVGGSKGLLDTSTRASIGGAKGLNTGVGANIGGSRGGKAASTGGSTGGGRGQATNNGVSAGGQASAPSFGGAGRDWTASGSTGFGQNAYTATSRTPSAIGKTRTVGIPAKRGIMVCRGAGARGDCSAYAGNSVVIRRFVAGMSEIEFHRNKRKCRGILADPNRYDRPLLELCRLLNAAAR